HALVQRRRGAGPRADLVRHEPEARRLGARDGRVLVEQGERDLLRPLQEERRELVADEVLQFALVGDADRLQRAADAALELLELRRELAEAAPVGLAADLRRALQLLVLARHHEAHEVVAHGVALLDQGVDRRAGEQLAQHRLVVLRERLDLRERRARVVELAAVLVGEASPGGGPPPRRPPPPRPLAQRPEQEGPPGLARGDVACRALEPEALPAAVIRQPAAILRPPDGGLLTACKATQLVLWRGLGGGSPWRWVVAGGVPGGSEGWA